MDINPGGGGLDEPWIKPSPLVIATGSDRQDDAEDLRHTQRRPHRTSTRVLHFIAGLFIVPIASIIALLGLPFWLCLRLCHGDICGNCFICLHDDCIQLPNRATQFSCGCDWCSPVSGLWLPCNECGGGRCWENEDLWYTRVQSFRVVLPDP